MSKIFIKQTHPAFKALKDQGYDVHPIEQASEDALHIGFVNLMPKPLDPVRDFTAACANSNHDIVIHDFAPDPETTSDKDRKAYREAHCFRIPDVDQQKLDAMIVTGHGVEHVPFDKLSFWPEVKSALDYAKNANIPVLASCLGAQAALYHHYNIEKTWDMAVYDDSGKKAPTNKISGHFRQKIIDAAHVLMQGIESHFIMPVSRYARSNDEEIRSNPTLTVLSESEETGISITTDGRLTCVTGHLEYPLEAVAEEYHRDIKNKTPHTTVPVGVFENDDPKKSILQNNWDKARSSFFGNWVNQVAEFKVANNNRHPSQFLAVG